jgi:acyl carrier protein
VRIEKNEIEYALWVTDWFKEVLVTTLPDATGEQQLIGYVVAKRNPAPTVTEIRQHLLTKLPVSMLPSAFVFLDALPLNINNKVDLRALPKPAGTRPTLAVAFAAPSNTLEHKLAQIWEDVLSIAPIGIHDHFLDLGGNSLRAMQIVSRISQQLQTMISPSTLLMQATIADMALTITEAQIKHIDSSMLEKMLDEIEAM